MARKAKGEHTPKRKRKSHRAASEPDQSSAKTPFVYPHLVSPRRAAEQERLRQFGEKHGLNRIAERLKGVRAPAEPQEPTPQRKRGHGGRPRSIPQDQIDRGIGILRKQPKMLVKEARRTLREAGIKGEDGPLYRLIIKRAYAGMSK